MSDPSIEVVERYLNGLRKGDMSDVPFAADAEFEDPLSGRLVGVEPFLRFIGGLFPNIRGVRVERHIREGEYVATLWEADTVWGRIPVFEMFRVVDERIREVRGFFDPRPITGAG